MMKSILLAATLVLFTPPMAFAQMSHDGNKTGGHDTSHMANTPALQAQGTINAVNTEKHTVNITHDPIAALGWPSMTMDFAVAQSISLTDFKQGTPVTFSLSRGGDGIYMIDQLKAR